LSRPSKGFASVAGFQAVGQPFPMDLELNLFFKMPDQVAYEKWQWQSHMQRRIIDSNGHLFCVIFLHFL
jgi:hypothetical protein